MFTYFNTVDDDAIVGIRPSIDSWWLILFLTHAAGLNPSIKGRSAVGQKPNPSPQWAGLGPHPRGGRRPDRGGGARGCPSTSFPFASWPLVRVGRWFVSRLGPGQGCHDWRCRRSYLWVLSLGVYLPHPLRA